MLTPLWCDRCGFYVPAEREPHVSHDHPTPHLASHRTVQEARDEDDRAEDDGRPFIETLRRRDRDWGQFG
jgi:hypothetical protein